MKNIIKIGLISLVGVFMFSGCGSSFIKVTSIKKVKSNYKGDASFVVTTKNTIDSDYSFTHMVQNNTDKFVFQGAALATIKKGYKYFRVVVPFDSSSAMITTPKELHEACFNKGVSDSIGVEFHVIKVKNCVNKSGKFASVASVGITVYKEKPNNVLVIDAQEFLDYLKEKDMYTDFYKIEYYSSRAEFKNSLK